MREEGGASGLPRYYLQNFHFQTDGYLSDGSARLYDTQVEVLFNGTANAMRRQALVPVAQHLGGRDQRTLSLVDVACGTGRYLRMLREAFPRLGLTGIDLSQAYLREARRHLGNRYRVGFVTGNAEDLPLPDASQDIVTSVFLFHELPPAVRRIVAAEFARVLKPGGILVFVDSLQIGDVDGYDRVLESFPGRFHEPYFDGYIRDDLDAIHGEVGLRAVSHTPAFLSKVSVYRKGRPVGA
jgi:ubiquinone/menaquinone biosynthesis C-methylase UbiE